jgi:hypothetical protein
MPMMRLGISMPTMRLDNRWMHDDFQQPHTTPLLQFEQDAIPLVV